ncbi:MAG: helix-turn-helix transcriptional regulator [Ruminococcaceae bacterium]|nr:helix-turn-helix transcriptional regulator [Oscillospiraceae bacterium]
MEKVTYIRHFYGKERQVSVDSSLFHLKPNQGEPYQDVIRFSNFDSNNFLVYTVGKHVYPQNHDMTISMQRWMVMFVADGNMRCGAQELSKGDFVVLPSSCSTTITSKKEQVLFYWCTTNDDVHISTLLDCGYQEKDMLFGHVDDMRPITEFFENTIYHFPNKCDDRTFLRGHLICLYSYIAPSIVNKQKVSDKLFSRCLQRIESSQGNVTVDFLAKHYFVSRRYLYTMFKEYKNMSPAEYILAVRMQAADKYLRSTNYSISEIAELTGYSNYSHFSRAYIKYFSITPSDRRKQVLEALISEERDTNNSIVVLDE